MRKERLLSFPFSPRNEEMGRMKANRKFIEKEAGVSAVIGVILMVAITVAIAATVYVYVSGMIGGGLQSTPNVSITVDYSDHNATISVGTPTANDIDWGDVDYTIVDLTTATELGDTNVTVTLGGSTGEVIKGGQVITVVGTGPSWDHLNDGDKYRFTLVYETTGGTMGTVTWTQ